MVKRNPVTLYSDSSVYQNGQPGKQEAWFAVVLEDGTQEGLLLQHVFIGDHSVNTGEYRGVIAALQWLHAQDLDRWAVVITDSKLVWSHVMDDWRCSAQFTSYRDRIRWLIEATGATFLWKPRAHNKAGHFFERIVEQRRKDRYRRKGEAKRTKRHVVRVWTFSSPQSGYTGTGDKFWPKVNKDGPIVTRDDTWPVNAPDPPGTPCWLWTGAKTSTGYGHFQKTGKWYQAHVWLWEQENGVIPYGLDLDHLCRVRLCIRPSHLVVIWGLRPGV